MNKVNHVFRLRVVIPTAILISMVTATPLLFPAQASGWFSSLKAFMLIRLRWFYNYTIVLFVFFALIALFSPWARRRLGPDDSKPSFSYPYWAAMILSSGVGVGMMYFGTAEFMLQYATPALSDLSREKRLSEALEYTFFHWGIHGWSTYALVGLAVAYFSFRYRLSSGLYPLFKHRLSGKLADAVDGLGLCAIFFGMLSTLAFGIGQINSGLQAMGWIQGAGISTQQILLTIVMVIVMVLGRFGPLNASSFFSYAALCGAFLLLLYVLVLGPSSYILDTFAGGLGNYLSQFFSWTLRAAPAEPARIGWSVDYTMLYWVSFICWSPYLGLYIARISRGRTIREFILTVLGIPALFNFVWMSVFGGSSVWMDQHSAGGNLTAQYSRAGNLLFNLLQCLPAKHILIPFSILVIVMFYILSFYLGADTLDRLSSRVAKNRPGNQFLFWTLLMTLSLAILLSLPGMRALQAMSLVMAFFLAIVILLACYCLIWDARITKKKEHRLLLFNVLTKNRCDH